MEGEKLRRRSTRAASIRSSVPRIPLSDRQLIATSPPAPLPAGVNCRGTEFSDIAGEYGPTGAACSALSVIITCTESRPDQLPFPAARSAPKSSALHHGHAIEYAAAEEKVTECQHFNPTFFVCSMSQPTEARLPPFPPPVADTLSRPGSASVHLKALVVSRNNALMPGGCPSPRAPPLAWRPSTSRCVMRPLTGPRNEAVDSLSPSTIASVSTSATPPAEVQMACHRSQACSGANDLTEAINENCSFQHCNSLVEVIPVLPPSRRCWPLAGRSTFRVLATSQSSFVPCLRSQLTPALCETSAPHSTVPTWPFPCICCLHAELPLVAPLL